VLEQLRAANWDEWADDILVERARAGDSDDRTMLRSALQTILSHYRGEEPRAPHCMNGLDAYDAWMDAFPGGGIEPNGNTYNLAVVGDARHHGAAFFQELATGGFGGAAGNQSLFSEAAEQYQSAALFRELSSLFPFPSGGEPNDPANSERAIRLLQLAKQHEQQAVSLLERMLEQLS
jgi:hypothetical protein